MKRAHERAASFEDQELKISCPEKQQSEDTPPQHVRRALSLVARAPKMQLSLRHAAIGSRDAHASRREKTTQQSGRGRVERVRAAVEQLQVGGQRAADGGGDGDGGGGDGVREPEAT